jgi:outer membrane lipoprotein-sorting protein
VKRIAYAASCFALVVSPWLLAATPPPKLTAAQIAEKNVAARGGAAAWRALGAMTLSGQMDAGGNHDLRLPFTMTLKRPHKSRLELRFDNQTAVQVYDGMEGWKVRPYLNRNEVEPFTAAEAKSAADWTELDGPLIDYKAKGTRIELAGSEAVEGKTAYKLKLTLKDGAQRHLWVDAKTFLEVKIDGEPRKIDGRLRKVAVFYRDFRSEKGLSVPRTLETRVEGVKKPHRISIQTVTVNPAVDDALFAKPQLASR